MPRRLPLLAIAVVLCACGTPVATTPTTPIPVAVASPATPTDSPATVPAAATVTVITMPTIATTTAPATVTATTGSLAATSAPSSAALTSPVQRGYVTLVLLQGTTALLEEMAQQIQSGKMDGFQGLGSLLAVGAITKAISDALNQPAPVPALATAWAEAKPEVQQIQDILSRWSDKKISSKDVPSELKPVETQINATLSAADAALAQEYGGNQAQLQQLRDNAIANLRASLQKTATPASTSQP